MKNLIKPLLISIVCFFLAINLQAQQPIREGMLTVASNTYEIVKASADSSYLIWNMNRSELIPNRDMVDGIPLELARTKMINKKDLKKIACEALGKEKAEQLATAKEKISGWIYYRADGTVISAVFKVSDDTKLTLNDLIRVEETLKTRFKADLESVGNMHQHLYYVRLDYEWDFYR